MNKFIPGQSGNPAGRARGSKNRLTIRVFEDVLRHWSEPSKAQTKDGKILTKGEYALDQMALYKPNEYVRAILSIMPKEVQVENVLSDLSNRDLDDLMVTIKEQLRAARADHEDTRH
jgi:hypothetical protein